MRRSVIGSMAGVVFLAGLYMGSLQGSVTVTRIPETASRPATAPMPATRQRTAADLPDYIQAYLVFRDAQFKDRIALYKSAINKAEQTARTPINPRGHSRYYLSQPRTPDPHIAEYKKKMRELLRIGHNKYHPIVQLTIKGDGIPAECFIKVGNGGTPTDNLFSPVKIKQILSDDSAFLEVDRVFFLAKGFNFKGMVNGVTFTPPGDIIATRTITYKTVRGDTNTVMQIEPFNAKDYEGY